MRTDERTDRFEQALRRIMSKPALGFLSRFVVPFNSRLKSPGRKRPETETRTFIRITKSVCYTSEPVRTWQWPSLQQIIHSTRGKSEFLAGSCYRTLLLQRE